MTTSAKNCVSILGIINAFTINWTPFYFYAFPNFSLIPRVLQKIRNDGATVIVVVPQWPTQVWFPVFLEMATSEILVFPPDVALSVSRIER